MSEFPKNIDRHWFVIARSSGVTKKPQRVTLFGRRWALARDRDDKVLVLEDRCPHRHAPLSAGEMTAEGLRCPYHGWTFNRGGSCVKIPGWPDGDAQPDVRVPSLAVVEHDGLVWAASHPVSQISLPRIVTTLEPGSRRFQWQTRWGAPILEALENFLDALHTHLIHPGLVRRDSARRRVATTLRSNGEGFTIDYEGVQAQSGILYRLFESRRSAERAHFGAPGVAQIEYRYVNGSAVWITLYFTPETANSTHVFTTLHVTGRWAPAWAIRLFVWPFLRQVARQDEQILELQTDTIEHFPPQRLVVTKLDLVRPYLEAWWGKAPAAELPKLSRADLML